jgi:putative ABC transport system permease protein
MARRFWPAETPMGRKISFTASGQNVTAEIIGVVGAVRPTGFDSEPRPEFYLHYPQSPAPLATFFVRTSGDPAVLLPSVKAEIREVNRNQAFLSVSTIAQLVDKTTAQRRFNLLWLGAFAVLALILAIVGLYGLISFSTAQRTKEIGVRMALGAQQSDVLKLVMQEGISLALIGVSVGLLVVAATSRLMKSLLFGISSTDPLTFSSVAILLTLVALLACYLPARRAMKVDPLVALRHE